MVGKDRKTEKVRKECKTTPGCFSSLPFHVFSFIGLVVFSLVILSFMYLHCSFTLFSFPWCLDMINYSLFCWWLHFLRYQINGESRVTLSVLDILYKLRQKQLCRSRENAEGRKSSQKFPSAHPLCCDWSKAKNVMQRADSGFPPLVKCEHNVNLKTPSPKNTVKHQWIVQNINQQTVLFWYQIVSAACFWIQTLAMGFLFAQIKVVRDKRCSLTIEKCEISCGLRPSANRNADVVNNKHVLRLMVRNSGDFIVSKSSISSSAHPSVCFTASFCG